MAVLQGGVGCGSTTGWSRVWQYYRVEDGGSITGLSRVWQYYRVE